MFTVLRLGREREKEKEKEKWKKKKKFFFYKNKYSLWSSFSMSKITRIYIQNKEIVEIQNEK